MWSLNGAIVIRIVVAFVLTFALGWERQIRGSAAGDRTFALIGVATAVIGVLASGAPTIMTGAITGVGFIGAGLLFRGSDAQIGVVHGMTTAAAVLAAAAIGAIAGEGQPLLACLATAAVLLILEIRYIPVIRVLDASRWEHRFQSDRDHGHVVATERTVTVIEDLPAGVPVPPHGHGARRAPRQSDSPVGAATLAAAYATAASASVAGGAGGTADGTADGHGADAPADTPS
ncbi:MAG TPA: MgtC/SapB family protein [Micromonosporaceae bacterium]|nr:MgtC/SapB family protein [Micromonosporaceae bacterium]